MNNDERKLRYTIRDLQKKIANLRRRKNAGKVGQHPDQMETYGYYQMKLNALKFQRTKLSSE